MANPRGRVALAIALSALMIVSTVAASGAMAASEPTADVGVQSVDSSEQSLDAAVQQAGVVEAQQSGANQPPDATDASSAGAGAFEQQSSGAIRSLDRHDPDEVPDGDEPRRTSRRNETRANAEGAPERTAAGADDAPLDPALENASGEVEVVVRLDEARDRPGAADASVQELRAHAATTQRPLQEFVRRSPHVDVDREFWITNAVLLQVDTDRVPLDRLLSIEHVDRIHANFEVETLGGAAPVQPASGAGGESVVSPSVAGAEPSAIGTPPASDAVDAPSAAAAGNLTYGLEMINASQVWTEYGARGGGVDVAVLDTGVDPDHPTIDLDGWARVSSDGNVTNTSLADAEDTGSHGTHVSGTVVGTGADGTHIGVAPNASLHHGMVLDGGRGTFAQVIGGMEWAVQDVEADVLSMSLGTSSYSTEMIDPVRNANANGTLVVAAIGNSGHEQSGSPGNVYEAMAVGAVDESRTVASFSSGEEIDTDAAWGENAPDDWPESYTTPDVSAPGVDVYSATPDGGYTELDGTSMATPHVAGAVALLLSVDGGLTNDEVARALEDSATHPDGAEKDDRYGEGILDAYSAVRIVQDLDTTVTGQVTDAEGTPIENATVASSQWGQATTNATGHYALEVFGEPQTVTADAFGWAPESAEIDGSESDTISQNFTLTHSQLALETTSGVQQSHLSPGETLSVEYRVANAETLTVARGAAHDYNGTVDLTVAGQAASFGDPVNVSSGITTVSVELTPTSDAIGTVSLDTTATGTNGSASATSTPVNVQPDPLVVDESDVQEYGSLQSIIDFAAPGTTIALENGTYVEETDSTQPYGAAVVLDDGTTLRAAEGASPTIELNDTADALDGVALYGTGTELSGIRVEGDGVGWVVSGGGTDVVVENTTVRDGVRGIGIWSGSAASVAGNDVDDASIGIEVSWAFADNIEANAIGSGVTTAIDGRDVSSVRDNRIEGSETGIVVDYGKTVRNNTITNAASGIHAQEIDAIWNNQIADTGAGIYVNGSTENVTGNSVTNATRTAIAVDNFGAAEQPTVANNTIAFSPPNHWWSAIDVRRSSEVDAIRDNRITIAGEDGYGVEIRDANAETTIAHNAIEGGFSGLFIDSDPRVVVRSNRINGSDSDGMFVGGRDGSPSPHLVEHNLVTNASGGGIDVSRANGSLVRNNTVENAGAIGLHLEDTSNATVRNNEFRSIYEHHGVALGARLLNVHESTLASNTVTGGSVDVTDSSDVTIDQLTVRDAYHGIRVTGTQYPAGDMSDHHFSGYPQGPSANVTVTDATVANVTHGLVVENGSADVAVDGVAVANATGSLLAIENATGTDVDGLAVANGPMLNASGENVSIATTAVPASHPVRSDLGVALEVATSSENAWLTTDLHYDESQVPDPGVVDLFRWDGSAWNGVDSTDEGGTVSSTVGQSGVYAPLAVATGSLDGTVTDANGTAVENATVSVLHDGRVQARGTTNATGAAAVDAVPVGTHTVNVSARGFEVDSASVSIQQGTTTVHDVSLDAAPVYFGVDDLEAPASITAGDAATIGATVTNYGTSNGTRTVEYVRDGAVVANRTISLNAGESRAVSFETTIQTAGTYEHGIRTQRESLLAQLSVASESDDDGSGSGGDDSGGGGGGGGYAPPPPSDPSPEFSVASIDVGTTEVTVGEPVSVDVQVDNDGDADGEYTATLTAGGQSVASETASINANWHETLTLSTSFDEPGTHQLAVGGETAGTVTVTGETDLAVTDASVDETQIAPGEMVGVTATVENLGGVAGSAEIALAVDGEPAETTVVSVPAGETKTVTFETTLEEPGTAALSVEGETAGTVVVEGAEDDSGDGEDGGNDGTPGFGALATLLGILLGALVAVRRTSN